MSSFFNREFLDKSVFESGHKIRNRIVNIICYLIMLVGILAMLFLPAYATFYMISNKFWHNHPHPIILVGGLVTVWLIALTLSALLFYGVNKSQLPEE